MARRAGGLPDMIRKAVLDAKPPRHVKSPKPAGAWWDRDQTGGMD